MIVLQMVLSVLPRVSRLPGCCSASTTRRRAGSARKSTAPPLTLSALYLVPCASLLSVISLAEGKRGETTRFWRSSRPGSSWWGRRSSRAACPKSTWTKGLPRCDCSVRETPMMCTALLAQVCPSLRGSSGRSCRPDGVTTGVGLDSAKLQDPIFILHYIACFQSKGDHRASVAQQWACDVCACCRPDFR